MSLIPLDRERLKSHIRDNGYRQWWVSESGGIHKSTLRRWLNGKIVRVRKERLERIAALVEIPVEALVKQ